MTVTAKTNLKTDKGTIDKGTTGAIKGVTNSIKIKDLYPKVNAMDGDWHYLVKFAGHEVYPFGQKDLEFSKL